MAEYTSSTSHTFWYTPWAASRVILIGKVEVQTSHTKDSSTCCVNGDRCKFFAQVPLLSHLALIPWQVWVGQDRSPWCAPRRDEISVQFELSSPEFSTVQIFVCIVRSSSVKIVRRQKVITLESITKIKLLKSNLELPVGKPVFLLALFPSLTMTGRLEVLPSLTAVHLEKLYVLLLSHQKVSFHTFRWS